MELFFKISATARTDGGRGLVLDAVGLTKLAGEGERGHVKISGFGGLRGHRVDTVRVWGVPLARLSMPEAVAAIGGLIKAARPSYCITANVHYAMLSGENRDLPAINERAALILADGAPLVWASRWQRSPLPERVAGSDLIFELCAFAAHQGYRVFLLGGADGVADEAARRLRDRYFGLQIVGTESPPYRELPPDEEAALIERIRTARADILLVAFGQPKGERWIVRNLDRLAIPVSVQVGASLDFAANRIPRAPIWMQNCGLEWAFRLRREPRRLFPRYIRNAWFIARMVATHSWRCRQPGARPPPGLELRVGSPAPIISATPAAEAASCQRRQGHPRCCQNSTRSRTVHRKNGMRVIPYC